MWTGQPLAIALLIVVWMALVSSWESSPSAPLQRTSIHGLPEHIRASPPSVAVPDVVNVEKFPGDCESAGVATAREARANAIPLTAMVEKRFDFNLLPSVTATADLRIRTRRQAAEPPAENPLGEPRCPPRRHCDCFECLDVFLPMLPSTCGVSLTGARAVEAYRTRRFVSRRRCEHCSWGNRDRGGPSCRRAYIGNVKSRRGIIGDEPSVYRYDAAEKGLRDAADGDSAAAVACQ